MQVGFGVHARCNYCASASADVRFTACRMCFGASPGHKLCDLGRLPASSCNTPVESTHPYPLLPSLPSHGLTFTISSLASSSIRAGSCALRHFSVIAEPDDVASIYKEQLNTPNYVTPISVQQLSSLIRNPTLRRLSNSAAFIKQQLPARLENHMHRLKVMMA
jgi:hypothetical protein